MAFIQASLLVAFACLVTGLPEIRSQLTKSPHWKISSSQTSQTIMLDGSFKELALIKMNVTTYNLVNSSYHQMVTDRVRQGLSKIKIYPEVPEDNLNFYEFEKHRLPLSFNMTQEDVVFYGPNPTQGFGMVYHIDVYSKKQHRADVLGALKNLAF
ncbi:uncharacterized protein LOC129001394 [Macrosteles quadrilineatus]|uniref:uncharacterized protein LOC129001394 n=1 Tax=Macrosteles quadrilineatus TaxID=74068 RepID=UPI0023E17C65|nr:uncharacterized protein LOC129001394 [Macrosteles quadrilineatus]